MGWRTVWVLCVAIQAYCAANGDSIVQQLQIGEKALRFEFAKGQLYNYSVYADPTDSKHFNISSFVFQVHAEKYNLTLRNTTGDCKPERECVTNGTHIGLVQLLQYKSLTATFSVGYFCEESGEGVAACADTQQVLIGVVGIAIYEPIPGGCTLTSALEVEAGFFLASEGRSSSLIFEDSSMGYDPHYTDQPSCSDKDHYITRLEYQVYQECLTYSLEDTNKTFDLLEGMMTPLGIQDNVPHYPLKKMSYNEAKRVVYILQHKRGVIFNVVATDTMTRVKSVYIPTVSYGCDLYSGECDSAVPASTWVCSILVGLTGLYLCLLAHRFIHVEVVLFTLLISVYLLYMVLFSLTDWEGTDLLVGTIGGSVVLTILLFVLWFFTNWYFLFLLLFGASMGYVITATMLFTPLGTFSVVKVSYVYALILVSGAVVFMIPFMLFSTVLNIVSSAVVGSYAVMFSVSLFVDSALSDVVLRIVWNAGISGTLPFNSFCAMATIDIILWCGWLLLCLLSILVQSCIELFRRRSFKRKQAEMRTYKFSTNYDWSGKKLYRAFPEASLFAKLRKSMALRKARSNMQFETDGQGSGDRRPLLSPSTLGGSSYNSMATH